jgi:hypothetical protein
MALRASPWRKESFLIACDYCNSSKIISLSNSILNPPTSISAFSSSSLWWCAGLTKPPPAGFRGSKKPVGKPVKPAGLLFFKKYRHGLLVGTGPVRVPGRTGSQRFG